MRRVSHSKRFAAKNQYNEKCYPLRSIGGMYRFGNLWYPAKSVVFIYLNCSGNFRTVVVDCCS